MLDVSIINTIITGAVTVAVAILGYYTAKAKKRDEARRDVDRCIMGMTAANSDALLIVLKHLNGEHLNGDVEHAIKAIESERDEYSEKRDDIISKL